MKRPVEYVDLPQDADQRISAIHVWIATQPDGSEGLISADLDAGPLIGMRHMPLMSSKRHIAEGFAGVADKMRKEILKTTGKDVTIRLVTFKQAFDA